MKSMVSCMREISVTIAEQGGEEEMPRYFTREEAEALLPQISMVLRRIQSIHQRIQRVEEEMADLQLRAIGNGHNLRGRITQLQQEMVDLVQALREDVDELQKYGCELKDAETGLIDFLSLREGEEIYLCWRLGEERILYWHYLDAGFAGRQPL